MTFDYERQQPCDHNTITCIECHQEWNRHNDFSAWERFMLREIEKVAMIASMHRMKTESLIDLCTRVKRWTNEIANLTAEQKKAIEEK